MSASRPWRDAHDAGGFVECQVVVKDERQRFALSFG